eukprot:CAMPEP_0203807570 /NCGR_PEP_ID=MMETSP0115-20131106/1144_1 /ASSEMBLY_ACC=CAM_ASM_000227 /TAXON_ID=33651 /ORGANISM="Bicosoecid sp, Strain ms1" /LENGTH=66 /DNA_ID=CAMNT_0050716253 /DNA_START=29 /DNA_END=226 /DNA_ORIENTATION=-
MSDLNPKKMKVAELRAELQARGLSTEGLKAALVQRLEQAIEDDALIDGAGGDDGGDDDVQAEPAPA